LADSLNDWLTDSLIDCLGTGEEVYYSDSDEEDNDSLSQSAPDPEYEIIDSNQNDFKKEKSYLFLGILGLGPFCVTHKTLDS